MTKIPKISKAQALAHDGETAAIVSGKIVVFAKDSIDAEKKALKMGFREEEIMVAVIKGRQNVCATSFPTSEKGLTFQLQ